MAAAHTRITPAREGELTLVLNAAEQRLQLVLGRPAPTPRRPAATQLEQRAAPVLAETGLGAGSEEGAKAELGARRGAEPETGQEASREVPPEIFIEQSWLAQSQGAELLTQAISQALTNLGLSPRHLGRVAAVSGPGGFTGLRLTAVTAAGFSRALGLRQAALPYLPLLAEGAAACAAGACNICIATHARRELLYWQSFERSKNGALREDGPLRVCNLEEAAALLLERACGGQETLLAGSGFRHNQAALHDLLARGKNPAGRAESLGSCGEDPDARDKGPGAHGEYLTAAAKKLTWPRLLPPVFDSPPALLLLEAALRPELQVNDIEPLYIRPSDAEEDLEQISVRLGHDATLARRRLQELQLTPPGESAK